MEKSGFSSQSDSGTELTFVDIGESLLEDVKALFCEEPVKPGGGPRSWFDGDGVGFVESERENLREVE